MKKSILTSLFTLVCVFAFAQGVMTFEKTTHEFGDVKETGGPISFDFKFKNTGDQPIIISNVQASCGCTTPDWTKTPVAPGQSGMIKAQYNPLGRPGQFNKTLTITSNAIEASSVVYIKGNVVPDVATTPAPTTATAPATAKPSTPVAAPKTKTSTGKSNVKKPVKK